jgi:hypothetical protein
MRCGAELRPDAKFCGVCGQVMGGQQMGSQNTGSQPTAGQSYGGQQMGGQPYSGQPYGGQQMGDGYQPINMAMLKNAVKTAGRAAVAREANRIQGGVIFSVDERIVRHYQIGRYFMRKGSIELIVTNKRVIRFEESTLFGMRNNMMDEIDIQSITGVSASMRRSASILGLTAGLILLLVGIVGLTKLRDVNPLIPLAALLLSFIILFLSFKPSLMFYVHGGGGRALTTVVNSRGRIFGIHNIGTVFQFRPTPEVTDMLKEIGALIYDIRTLGDKGIERWC